MQNFPFVPRPRPSGYISTNTVSTVTGSNLAPYYGPQSGPMPLVPQHNGVSSTSTMQSTAKDRLNNERLIAHLREFRRNTANTSGVDSEGNDAQSFGMVEESDPKVYKNSPAPTYASICASSSFQSSVKPRSTFTNGRILRRPSCPREALPPVAHDQRARSASMAPHCYPNAYSPPATDMVIHGHPKETQQCLSPVASSMASTPTYNSPRLSWEDSDSLILPSSMSLDESKDVIKYKSNFTTSRCLQGAPRQVDPRILAEAQAQGVDLTNTRYKGDLNATTIANLQASWADNCGTFIPSLPEDIKDHEIIDTVAEGKIKAFNKKMPKGDFKTCAAEIAFFTPEAARAYVRKGMDGGVVIRGTRVKVMMSRIKIAPTSISQLYESRVIQIWGPPGFLRTGEWYVGFMREKVKFQLLSLRSWSTTDGRDVREFVFSSLFGQASLARRRLIDMIWAQGLHNVLRIRYGPDPCEPSERDAWINRGYTALPDVPNTTTPLSMTSNISDQYSLVKYEVVSLPEKTT